MAGDDKKKGKHDEEIVDLSARIGARRPEPKKPAPPTPPREEVPPPPPTRHDAPIPSEPRPRLLPPREDRQQRDLIQKALTDEDAAKSQAIPSPRTPPGPGEVDLVVTPLPTPDDWHRFELALRRVRGVGQLRTEYYRHGVLKVRVSFQGTERLATLLRAGIQGYRVRIIGEDRTTLQVLVASDSDDRRPG
ncbi:MAG: hypothetical protein E6H88_13425 [Chloroflexi bacterium]|nr:MAG: hypothetical protein E6I20_03240 [Chloroflexota bacterium]TMG35128.1 MAG: hypothetical protein E6H88_13425 [Chloroflexota bacterium]